MKEKGVEINQLLRVLFFEFNSSVTRLLIPDNLKVGIIQNKKYEDPILNKSYQEMADYYDTTIIPTRVRKHHTVNLILPCFLVDLYYVLRLKKDGLL